MQMGCISVEAQLIASRAHTGAPGIIAVGTRVTARPPRSRSAMSAAPPICKTSYSGDHSHATIVVKGNKYEGDGDAQKSRSNGCGCGVFWHDRCIGELPLHINDDAFADACVDAFVEIAKI